MSDPKMADRSKNIAIPSPETFLLEWPLYHPINFDWNNRTERHEVEKIQAFWGPLEAYCVSCGTLRTFRLESKCPYNIVDSEYALRLGVFSVKWLCTHHEGHYALFVYQIGGEPSRLVKIGQYPSLAEVMYPQIKRYEKLLGPYYSEFRSGIKAMTDGLAVGAYVYFRRVIEFLIAEAHIKAMNADGWDEEKFRDERVQEKIKLLDGFLPAHIVSNRSAYSILSLGIHSLSEQDCVNYCDVLRSAIEIILDEEVYSQEQGRKKAENASSISKINNLLSQRNRS